MKIFLCGGGSGKQILFAMNKFASIIDRSKPILYIPFAMEEEKYESCENWFSNEIKMFGLNKFEMVKSSKELSIKNLDDYSSIFIGGGNTFKLLKDLKQFSNFEKIRNYLNHDGIMFGGSAGAIILGKDINSCLMQDKNIVGLKETRGFNYLNDYSLLCHLSNSSFKHNKNYLKEYSKENKTIYLPEEDVIFIDNGKISMIGNKKYVIFDKEKCLNHNFANFKKDINK